MKKGNFRKSKCIHFAIENLKPLNFWGVRKFCKQLVYQNSRSKKEGICKKKKNYFSKREKTMEKKVKKRCTFFFSNLCPALLRLLYFLPLMTGQAYLTIAAVVCVLGLQKLKKNVQANFLMGLIFWTSWRVAPMKNFFLMGIWIFPFKKKSK